MALSNSIFCFVEMVDFVGLSTTILVVTFFSGVQLLSLGLIGEYIGRIYDEVKKRPLFIVDRVVDKINGRKS